MNDARAEPIVVTGDLTVDWMTISAPDSSALQLAYLWDRKASLSISPLPGGAALIASLLEDFGNAVRADELPAAALTDPRFPGVTQTFGAWSTMPATRGSTESRWRFREFLGQSPATEGFAREALPAGPVLVIDDANLGFRDARGDWDQALARAELKTVVLRMATPSCSGPLWERLAAGGGPNLVVYLSLGDLRKEDAAIGQALSWERTASEIVDAVRQRTELQAADLTVVGIGLSGAVIVAPGGSATLVYDPEHLEGDWEAMHPGIPYGVGSVITAMLADAHNRDAAPDVPSVVTRGLALARVRHLQGLRHAADGSLAFARSETPAPNTASFATATVPASPDWSVLSSRGELPATAIQVLYKGIGAAESGIPVERMGAWVSVDRTEIESIRSVRNIVGEYIGQTVRPRPLSIAVFGPPGSGKSFAIKQMAGHWSRDGARIEVLEFNISQLAGSDGLDTAFQRIRDCAVDGALPLVFWDEFDSVRDGRELGWLAQFLAPMQDGAFLEGSLVRPIGSAIFVFAGGTHSTMESFKAHASSLPGAKATDFLSRLRGFVDVLGPNRSSSSDASFTVRRALLLRQILLRRAPQLDAPSGLNIDPGVAHAFLNVERFVHGARSMEAIVEMSALSGRSRYGRSSLPALQQLSLHVDAAEFLRLLESR